MVHIISSFLMTTHFKYKGCSLPLPTFWPSSLESSLQLYYHLFIIVKLIRYLEPVSHLSLQFNISFIWNNWIYIYGIWTVLW